MYSTSSTQQGQPTERRCCKDAVRASNTQAGQGEPRARAGSQPKGRGKNDCTMVFQRFEGFGSRVQGQGGFNVQEIHPSILRDSHTTIPNINKPNACHMRIVGLCFCMPCANLLTPRERKKEKRKTKEKEKRKKKKKNEKMKRGPKGGYPPRRAENMFLTELLREIATKFRPKKNQILSPRQKKEKREEQDPKVM